MKTILYYTKKKCIIQNTAQYFLYYNILGFNHIFSQRFYMVKPNVIGSRLFERNYKLGRKIGRGYFFGENNFMRMNTTNLDPAKRPNYL